MYARRTLRTWRLSLRGSLCARTKHSSLRDVTTSDTCYTLAWPSQGSSTSRSPISGTALLLYFFTSAFTCWPLLVSGLTCLLLLVSGNSLFQSRLYLRRNGWRKQVHLRHSVFKSLLQYLYTDTVALAPDLAVDLLSLASRYGMDGLKAIYIYTHT
jgi:hypothetical protein